MEPVGAGHEVVCIAVFGVDGEFFVGVFEYVVGAFFVEGLTAEGDVVGIAVFVGVSEDVGYASADVGEYAGHGVGGLVCYLLMLFLVDMISEMRSL